MIQHTMIVSFDSDIPETELHQYLKDIEDLMMGSGRVEAFSARRHIHVPVGDHSPLRVATVIVQLDLADLEALKVVSGMPEIMEISKRWQARYPYEVVWANHEAL